MQATFEVDAIPVGWCGVHPNRQIKSPSFIERKSNIQAKKIHPALGTAAAGWK
jgi:hypothetical protein